MCGLHLMVFTKIPIYVQYPDPNCYSQLKLNPLDFSSAELTCLTFAGLKLNTLDFILIQVLCLIFARQKIMNSKKWMEISILSIHELISIQSCQFMSWSKVSSWVCILAPKLLRAFLLRAVAYKVAFMLLLKLWISLKLSKLHQFLKMIGNNFGKTTEKRLFLLWLIGRRIIEITYS